MPVEWYIEVSPYIKLGVNYMKKFLMFKRFLLLSVSIASGMSIAGQSNTDGQLARLNRGQIVLDDSGLNVDYMQSGLNFLFSTASRGLGLACLGGASLMPDGVARHGLAVLGGLGLAASAVGAHGVAYQRNYPQRLAAAHGVAHHRKYSQKAATVATVLTGIAGWTLYNNGPSLTSAALVALLGSGAVVSTAMSLYALEPNI